MAPLNTHVVVGERVFSQTPLLAARPALYGPFLLGCIIVDIHAFRSFPRSQTHFAERLITDGPFAFEKSCENFLAQLPALLSRSIAHLTETESAFLAGYMCHLAVDEEWQQHDWYLIHERGINVWKELPVPGSVMLTAFATLSHGMFYDFPAATAALRRVEIPDILRHIPYRELVEMWRIVKAHIIGEGGVESFLRLCQIQGMSSDDVAALRKEHDQYWDDAITMIDIYLGHPRTRLPFMTRRAVEVMPRFFQRLTAVHEDDEMRQQQGMKCAV